MKYFKKINLFLLLILLLNFGISTTCECVRPKKTVDGLTFSFLDGKKLPTRIIQLTQSFQHRKDENPGVIPPIIIGGRYYSVPHAENYESHHLISAHFCRAHKNVIKTADAPCVLILKNIHRFTGSYDAINREQYFKMEEEAYRLGGLEAVLELGIKDLNKIINNHYAYYKRPSTPKFTPYRNALAALQRIDPLACPGEDLTQFITTPLKAKRPPILP